MAYVQNFNFSNFGFPSISPVPVTGSQYFSSPYSNEFQQQPQQYPLPSSIVPEYNGGQDYYGNSPSSPQYVRNSLLSQGDYQQPQSEIVLTQTQSSRKRKSKKGQRATAASNPILRTSPPEKEIVQTSIQPEITRVTPIQGPIYARDGFVPVVPLYSYPSVNNGTFYQIPILWTALSVALGLEVRGEILRGLPCIKRHNQLFCPTAGTTYPLEKIEIFIDENKALVKRMYGEFVMLSNDGVVTGGYGVRRRSTREVYEHEIPDVLGSVYLNKPTTPLPSNETSSGNSRPPRQTVNPPGGGPSTDEPRSNRVDSCESKVEITTPYWAANSAGKVRAIVNTKHFEQAIHQEICTKSLTTRCSGECGCEQKYKWHRLLSYDPGNECKGIFMDWFLFGSCCVCRCNP